ncbi:PREDICTED: uncharacterized protein LOC105960738 [Erythranthe guttata]|uniref:uncharacterized protein LOC105960738 n=1 Tax=Erythranthe guttata TaxID=4155 RepID=UPI00064DA8DA|nr:PREDICTED: uncharacterized protein LOC105960738 [Erythranthe guttata]|eukprot:XP_012840401.1 PREDICTED: uncharacterized protein LOC105960738 [Erythranthe guttata]
MPTATSLFPPTSRRLSRCSSDLLQNSANPRTATATPFGVGIRFDAAAPIFSSNTFSPQEPFKSIFLPELPWERGSVEDFLAAAMDAAKSAGRCSSAIFSGHN